MWKSELLKRLPKRKEHLCILSNKDLIFTGKLKEGRTIKDWIKYGYNAYEAEVKKILEGMEVDEEAVTEAIKEEMLYCLDNPAENEKIKLSRVRFVAHKIATCKGLVRVKEK